MVLTKEQYTRAANSSKPFIRNCVSARSNTPNFIAQCCSDREIQVALRQRASPAYDFNCKVVHNPHDFAEFVPFPGCGWNEKHERPDDDRMDSLWNQIIQADMKRLKSMHNGKQPARNETRQEVSNPANRGVSADEEEPDGCGLMSLFLSCFT